MKKKRTIKAYSSSFLGDKLHFIQFNCVKEPTIIPMGIRQNLCLVKLKKTEGLYEANHEGLCEAKC